MYAIVVVILDSSQYYTMILGAISDNSSDEFVQTKKLFIYLLRLTNS